MASYPRIKKRPEKRRCRPAGISFSMTFSTRGTSLPPYLDVYPRRKPTMYSKKYMRKYVVATQEAS